MTAKLKLVEAALTEAHPPNKNPPKKSPPKKKRPVTAKSTDKAPGARRPGPKKAAVASKAKKTGESKSAPARKPEMLAKSIMMTDPVCCRPGDSLNTAARLLWETNLGALVVVGDDQKPLSMITDRDLCMAAYTQGVPLAFGHVGSAMASRVVTCREDDTVGHVLELMAAHQLRRIPVVDASEKLVGIVGLRDLVRQVGVKSPSGPHRGITPAQMVGLMASLLSPPSAGAFEERHAG